MSARTCALLSLLPQSVPPRTVVFASADGCELEEPGRSAFLLHALSVVLGQHCDCVAVRRLPASHRAAPGRGLFATANVAAGTPLLVYGGTLLVGALACRKSKRLADGRSNRYVFDCTALAGGDMQAVVDASGEPRCAASFVNDARGSGVAPNVGCVELVCGGGEPARGGGCQPALEHPVILMYTCRPVAAGEELTTEYGDAFWRGAMQRRAWR